ncbi:MAG: hypothetical protein A4S09_13225 [Proteobacteria bacterium SG_bin7]|nr:MAG: hypothetical protein A4S09_13225 [Proteobacteria bacterium SG_bin7]
MQTLLITPPLIQMNSPYPATAYLTGYLKKQGLPVEQRDLSLEFLLKVFSKDGLDIIRKEINVAKTDSTKFFLGAFDDYQTTIESVINFLQGNDPSLALRIAERKLLPEGPRFLPLSQHESLLVNFGALGVNDKAKYIASLYLDDIADVIQKDVDENFQFSRYGEQLASSQTSFDSLYERTKYPSVLITKILSPIVQSYLDEIKPELIGFTIPFPGNFLGALHAARIVKTFAPNTKIVIGGGFINTELRELSDKRIFEFTDYIVFDDGEIALEKLIKGQPLSKTWHLSEETKEIVKHEQRDPKNFRDYAYPTFIGLDNKKYFSMIEMPNRMHRFWSDFKWNKIILAHGCYWKKCTFCDVTLDYIERFEPLKSEEIVDMMERLAEETGSTGFHFVDEAAPPALLKAMATEIIKRRLTFSWWGNIRFDSFFTPDVTDLLADSGCVAVSGGLEVASPRLLKLINKGVNLPQVTEVTKAFRNSGIFVHAYLMYGFPTQTTQETIDSLEVVRNLFKNQCIDSAFWHRFVCTIHSPIGKNPEKFNLILFPPPKPKSGVFAVNTIPFHDPTGTNHDALGKGLKKALYNYMHGVGIDEELQFWFDIKIPKPKSVKEIFTP